VLNGIKKRGRWREPERTGIQLFYRDRRLQEALRDFGGGNDYLFQGHLLVRSVWRQSLAVRSWSLK
jgi:hypothetical protein